MEKASISTDQDSQDKNSLSYLWRRKCEVMFEDSHQRLVTAILTEDRDTKKQFQQQTDSSSTTQPALLEFFQENLLLFTWNFLFPRTNVKITKNPNDKLIESYNILWAIIMMMKCPQQHWLEPFQWTSILKLSPMEIQSLCGTHHQILITSPSILSTTEIMNNLKHYCCYLQNFVCSNEDLYNICRIGKLSQ